MIYIYTHSKLTPLPVRPSTEISIIQLEMHAHVVSARVIEVCCCMVISHIGTTIVSILSPAYHLHVGRPRTRLRFPHFINAGGVTCGVCVARVRCGYNSPQKNTILKQEIKEGKKMVEVNIIIWNRTHSWNPSTIMLQLTTLWVTYRCHGKGRLVGGLKGSCRLASFWSETCAHAFVLWKVYMSRVVCVCVGGGVNGRAD